MNEHIEHIEQFIESKVESQEEDLQNPLGERLMKATVVAAAGVFATAIAGAIWDHIRNRPETVELEAVDVPQDTE